MKRVGKLIGASVTIQKCTSLNGNSVKVRDRPNRMTRNLEKQIIELSKLMRSDTRISSPIDGSTDDKRHDVIKRKGLSVWVQGLLYQKYTKSRGHYYWSNDILFTLYPTPHILGIKLWREQKNRMLGLSQAGYIDKILARFIMQNSKKGLLPFRHGVPLFDDQRPKTFEEEKTIRQVPYASAVGSLMYVMLCTRLDICYLVGIVSRYQSNLGSKHWEAVKHILKYKENTRLYACLPL